MKPIITILLLGLFFIFASNGCKTSPTNSQPLLKSKLKPVNNLTDLLQNLGSKSYFELAPGKYNISNLDTSMSGKYFQIADYFEGNISEVGPPTLIFQNMDTVMLRGIGNLPSSTELFSEDEEAVVLAFINCKNIFIDNLWLGHKTTSYSCTGNVLSFGNCGNIYINNTQVYGTGYHGIDIWTADKLHCTNVDIYDCSDGPFDLNYCQNIYFKNSKFYDNESRYSLFSLHGCPNAIFEQCSWTSNTITEKGSLPEQRLFSVWDSKVILRGGIIAYNQASHLVVRRSTDQLILDKVELKDNKFGGEREIIK